MGEIFLISDTHFDHGNIITHCKRPFRDWREMNEAMIANWNEVVDPNDEVYHLGDFTYGRKRRPIRYFVNRLNGKIHFIMGSHDKPGDVAQAGFASVQSYLDIRSWRPKKRGVVLFHFPIESWQGAFREAVHFHGHSHGNLKHILPGRMDISADCIGFTPIHLEEAIAKVPTGEFSEGG